MGLVKMTHNILKTSILSCFFVIMVSCGGGSNTEPTDKQANLEEPKVYINPDDGTLLSFSLATGESYRYFGRKDGDGKPQLITEVEYLDAEGKHYRIGYNASGIPTRVADENGTVIEFAFIPDGTEAQRNPEQKASTIISNSVAALVRFTDPEIGEVQFNTRLNLDQPIIVTLDQALQQVAQAEPEGNLTIRTTQCGEPKTLNRPVVVDFRYSKSSLTTRYEAYPSPSEAGKYIGRIPVNPVDHIPARVEAYCDDVATLLSLTCAAITPPPGSSMEPLTIEAASAMCATLAIQMAASPALPAAPEVGAACEAFFVAGIIACKSENVLALSTDGDPNPLTGKNVLARMCSTITATSGWIDSVTGIDTAIIRASADFTGPGSSMINVSGTSEGLETTGEVVVPSAGPFPELHLNHVTPVIESFTVDPLSPDPIAGYTATAEFSCVDGSLITMDVSGEELHITGATAVPSTKNDTLSLNIPPRSGNPKIDIFTLKAEDPIYGGTAVLTPAVLLAKSSGDGSVPPVPGPITSDFDNSIGDNEGWKIGPRTSGTDFSNCGPAEHKASGGNPDGFISHREICNGMVPNDGWYFVAPDKFHGDMSNAFGRSLDFDLRSNGDLNPLFPFQTGSLVVLHGGGKYIYLPSVHVANYVKPHGGVWTNYSFPLSTDDPRHVWWMSTSNLLNPAQRATNTDLQEVLTNLDGLSIFGDFSSAETDLDNVILGKP